MKNVSENKQGSTFSVKLKQIWCFDRNCGAEWNGLWETISVFNFRTEKERWTIRRAFVTGDGQKLNEKIPNIPSWLLLRSARCLKLSELYNPNEKRLEKFY